MYFAFAVVMALIVGLPVSANPGQELANSFQQQIVALDWARFLDTSGRVRLALPSHLENWGVINQEAAATYNDWINTIVLKPDAMGRDGQGNFRLPTIQELRSRNNGNLIPTLPTILHEMAHAEFDFFVEEEATEQDSRLFRIMENEMAPWMERTNSGLRRRNLRVALSELFSYYRGDFFHMLLEDWDDQLFLNGYYRHQNRCSKSKLLLREAEQTSLEEFRRLKPVGDNLDVPYRDRHRLSTVWVKGKEVNLEGFPWWGVLWEHLQHVLRPPGTKRDLVKRMERTPWVTERVVACREKIWSEAHNGAGSR